MKSKGARKKSKAQNCFDSSVRMLMLALLAAAGMFIWWKLHQFILDHQASPFSRRERQVRPGGKSYVRTGYRVYAAAPVVRKRRVAFAITMTKDGSFQDGAAVLAYSLFSTNMTTTFDVSLVAFVHPNVTTSRPFLRRIGYHVIEAPTPLNTSAIQFEFLRTKMDRNGCCGAAELIKLNSYRLTQYDVVVHMDADTYFVNPIPELLEDRLYSLIYTTDPNMATFKQPECMPAQGGFLVIKPSVADYEALINTLMTTDFVIFQGWNSSHIGWYWGGMTVQGILPYYYNRITAPGRSIKVDRCIYNTMADTPDCAAKNLTEVKSAHFTVCLKPWTCQRGFLNRLCRELHHEWLRLRLLTEEFYGIPPEPEPCVGGYRQMRLERAVLTPAARNAFIPDDSPDRLLPIGNTGFLKS